MKRIVIVGGGAAGWITAGVIASKYVSSSGIQVSLIESPDVNPIGVGEGTWPSMRTTLQSMGVSESDFIRECDASFKQGSRFANWLSLKDQGYYHPFSLPIQYRQYNLAPAWYPYRRETSFAHAVTSQSHICDLGLAPKQITTPEYTGVTNYGYHLDAGKFSKFLHKHCVDKLGVKYISDHVVEINSKDNGDIQGLILQTNGYIEADLFIDCTGLASLLLGRHFQIPFLSKHNILFNDSALAIQVPYASESSPIVSHTLSTAQSSGWIWDIGLPSRRGVGHVYSSAHISDENAEVELRKYVSNSIGEKAAAQLPIRKISISPGHRQVFWYRNCVAVGMSAGFIEPLEATALVLIEQSAKMISEHLPSTRSVMDIVAKRYNETFVYHWGKIVEFLKLHYVLTKRKDSQYWVDNCNADSIPDDLQELLELWKYQSPWVHEEKRCNEMFPSASYQYILYGMQFEPIEFSAVSISNQGSKKLEELFAENAQNTQRLLVALQTNRELLDKIKKHGLQKI